MPSFTVTCLADRESMSRTTSAETRPACLDEFAELHRPHGVLIEGPKPLVVDGPRIRCPHCGADLAMTEQTGGTIQVPSLAYFYLKIRNGEITAMDAWVEDRLESPACSNCGGPLAEQGAWNW